MNNCIGLRNYRFFIWFLAQHVWFTGYGTYLVANMLSHVISSKNLWHLSYKDPKSGAYVPADAFFLFQYISYYHGALWGLFLLLSIMCFVLFGFTVYHLYLALTNTTTNERSKAGWIQQGINVHAYAELHALNPYYVKIQRQLKELNGDIIRQAYADVGREPPNKKEKALTAAATAATTAQIEGKPHAQQQQPQQQVDPATGVVLSPAASSPSASGFPPPPYSAALVAQMSRYHTLKTEVISVYTQIQKLQAQEFTSGEHERAVREGRPLEMRRQGETMRVAAVEATEGCVPTSVAPGPAASSSSSSTSSAAAARRPNPYSLGWRRNFLQLIFPPKIGERVPSATAAAAAATEDGHSEKETGEEKASAESDEKKSSSKKPQGKKHR